jgi:hypothetical protein
MNMHVHPHGDIPTLAHKETEAEIFTHMQTQERGMTYKDAETITHKGRRAERKDPYT